MDLQHATIIQPPSVHNPTGTIQVSIPPIGPAYVAAALLEAGCGVDVIDGVGEWIDQYTDVEFAGERVYVHGADYDQILARLSPETQLVGVSCMFSHTWPNTRELVKRIRAARPDVLLVLGGEHCSALAEQVLRESGADLVVIGEGESTVVDLLDALRTGRPLSDVPGIGRLHGEVYERTTARKRVRELKDIPRPAWHLIPVDAYIRKGSFHGARMGVSMPILGTRGCPYQCTFCSSAQMWTTRWLARDPVDVCDEMASYRETYGANDFHFEDLTMVVKKDWIIAFCDEIERRGWKDITLQLPSGTRSEAIDFEVASRLRAVGCPTLSYAPESGSPSVLARIKKRVDIDRMIVSIKDSRRAGVKVDCFIIYGFPDETYGEIWQTFKFITRLAWIGAEGVGVGTYMPIPGTESADALVAEGRIAYDDDLFISLLGSNDMVHTRSWNPRMGERTLAAMRLGTHLWFYGLSFLLRPMRFLRTVRNLAIGSQETKFDKVLQEVLGRGSPAS